MKLSRIILVLVLSLCAVPAQAHPHLFLRYHVVLTPVKDGSLLLHFTFTSRMDANPLLTPNAQAGDTPLLLRDMMANLTQHPFFLYLDVDGKNIGQQSVQLVPSGTQGDDETYSFDLSLPGDLKNFGFSLYDPTYFDYVWQDGAQAVDVKTKLHCAVTVQDVGKTVWGILQTQYVQCGDALVPAPHMIKKQELLEAPQKAQPLGVSRDLMP